MRENKHVRHIEQGRREMIIALPGAVLLVLALSGELTPGMLLFVGAFAVFIGILAKTGKGA